MRAHIIDLGDGMGESLVSRYLEPHPEVVTALTDAGACVVVFEWERGAGDFFERAGRALALAEAAAPAGAPALFVGLTSVSEIVKTGAFALGGRTSPAVPLPCRRGEFIGYIAIGEGGVGFFGPDGAMEQPDPATVLEALRRGSLALDGAG